ncbi:hypothetical protein [Shewanella woodyi]|uniref:hypothetical protein n=1 Tax=Shewanella woodyi TaxID=60961 RepID=UPI0007F87B3E|nr:hypothetical protein [Shewanella woodyi]
MISRIIIFTLLCLLTLSAPAADRLTFPIPKFFKLNVIADDLNFNGANMSMTGFETNKTAEDIFHFYQQEWDGKINTSYFGNWIIYSHLKKGLLFTVQFKQKGQLQISGILALSNLPGIQSEDFAHLGKGFPMPKDTKVANDIKADDGGRLSRTLLLINKQSLQSNFKFYQNKLSNEGWTIQYQQKTPASRSAAMLLAKDNSTLNLMMEYSDGETKIQAVRMDN